MEKSVEVVEMLRKQTPGQTLTVDSAYVTEPNLGVRKTMEDFVIHAPELLPTAATSFFAVLDGHGGSTAAEHMAREYPSLLAQQLTLYESVYSSESILASSLELMENNMRLIDSREAGSTFCAALIDRRRRELVVASVGDSQILQIACEAGHKLSAGFLCQPHKTSNAEEVRRIANSGGILSNGRVGGFLAITRSVGDFDLKKYGVVSTPEVHKFSIDTTSLLVIASDGVWDVVQPENVMDLLVADQALDCEELARVIAQEAVIKGSLDNISVVCILIH